MDDTEGCLVAQDNAFYYTSAKQSLDADGRPHCRAMLPGHGVLQRIVVYYAKHFG